MLVVFSTRRSTAFEINLVFMFCCSMPGKTPASVRIWKPLQTPKA